MGDKDLNKKKAVHQLGVFGFFAMTASMVMTVYEYPSFASSGFKLVFFLVVGGLLWFLPDHFVQLRWQPLKVGRKAAYILG